VGGSNRSACVGLAVRVALGDLKNSPQGYIATPSQLGDGPLADKLLNISHQLTCQLLGELRTRRIIPKILKHASKMVQKVG